VLAPEEDDLEVEADPRVLGEGRLEVAFGALDGGTVGETPARGEAMDVRVDGERRDAEGLGHDHARGLVTDAGERFELLEGARDAAAVLLDEHLREPVERFRLRRSEPAGLDQVVDLPDGELRHLLGGVRAREERRRHEVDARVGRLRGEDDGDEERERIAVAQRDRRGGVELVEHPADPRDLLRALHAGSIARVQSSRMEEFLAGSVYAVVGASNDRWKYGNKVLRCYVQNGKRAIPVNPRATVVEGLPAVPDLASLPEPVHGVSIITPPEVTEEIVEEAAKAGITRLWMQPGAESARAIERAEELGLSVIAGGPCLLVSLGFRER
jgi:predicted CoA-binding protein